MSENNIDLMFSPTGRYYDQAALTRELMVWELLKRVIVAPEDTAEAEQYRRELYRNAVSRIELIQVVLDEDSFIAEMKSQWSQLWAGRALDDAFKRIDANEFPPVDRDRLHEVLGSVRQYAPLVDGEDVNTTCTLGIATQTFGQIPAGALLVRREGRLPSHYVFPHITVDMVGTTLIRTPLARFAPELLDTGVRNVLSRPQMLDDTANTILGALKGICRALSYLPTVGPIAGIAQKLLSIVGLIMGSNSTNQFQTMLQDLDNIVENALLQQSITEQLANIRAFMDQYRADVNTLSASTDQPNYIKTTFLPLLNNQLSDTGSGSVSNSIHQLKSMYDQTPWTNIKVKEQLLQALGLGIGYQLVIHRTRVMLYAELAANAGEGNDTDYKNSMCDAMAQYDYAANDSDVSARELLVWMSNYYDQRFDETSVYWSLKGRFGYTTYYVYDRLDNNALLQSCNWASTGKGTEWAQETQEADYTSITQTATQNVMPVQDRARDMVNGYYQLMWQSECTNVSKEAATHLEVSGAAKQYPVFSAVVSWNQYIAYFFSEDKYVNYSKTRCTPLNSSYPAPVEGNWPGFPSDFLTPDAGVMWYPGWGRAYFFKGDQYIAFDVNKNTVLSGYPKPIAGNWSNWPTSWTGVDAILSWDTQTGYFFRGDEFAGYDISSGRIADGYPVKITDRWPGWPEDFINIDSAVKWDDQYCYFFKGNQFMRFNISKNTVDLPPTSIASGWPSLYWW